MKLSRLLEALGRRVTEPAHGTGESDVRGLCYDSRRAERGDLFIALKGLKASGSDFAADAIGRGAVAVVSDAPAQGPVTVPWVVVEDAREAMAVLSDEFYEHPSTLMSVVGITGTNGKTTTAYLLRALFEAAGMKSGLLGTVTYMVGDEAISASRTTPEAPDVQRMFRLMVDRGCAACVMEVSSHALALKRADGTRFAAGVFTNLTRDHLDYHKDMESYFSAKRRLFEMLPEGAPGVINLDDPRGESLVRISSRPITYAISRPADVTPGPLSLTWQGLVFEARTPRGPVQVRSRLVGRPNVSNILAAVSTAIGLGLPTAAIEAGLAQLEGVPGRFEMVSDARDDIAVVVDYAHTDDALKNLLETARPLAQGRVITLFGCGGDRDRTKRPLMGAVASRLSDVVIVTSDNPRSEDPSRIIEEIKLGIQAADRAAGSLFAIVDRVEAIEQAVRIAEPGDLVLLAGKGHEKTQVIGQRELAFDEVEIARAALDRRRAGSRVH
ncbi:MAG TPA: UDP-N-acetylmuramoyl-L-alanyl-D-glutamate--2,6-diaminopimelate ligase [Vicinamibacterales bacterium]|nr:UDP-N-acetylmuramoyl-L-alanyl-D-glutamate--2,6-diaminopimelate ligase [Vicinamibacterales bacterium]